MKLKIVIKVPMHCEKAKSKAMQIASTFEGVSSVSIGQENDQLVVIGEGVDSVCVAKSLRKKFCFADIVSVEEVKPPPDKSPVNSSPSTPSPPHPYCPPPTPCIYPPPCQLTYWECQPVYDTGTPNCFIL